MKILLSGVLLLAFLLMIPSSLSTTSQYDFNGFTGSLDLTELGLSFNHSGACSIQMATTNTFTTNSGSFDSTIAWKSPDITTLGFSTLTGLSNTSCLSYGRTGLKAASTDATSGLFESSWDVTHSADSGFLTTETRYVCDVSAETTEFFITNSSDSRGACQFQTRKQAGNQRITFLNYLANNYNRCGDITDWSASGTCRDTSSGCTNCDHAHQYLYPFNSSATGDVKYNITDNLVSVSAGGQTASITFTVDLINTVTGSITNLHTELRTVSTTRQFLDSGSLSLATDTQYLLVMTFNTSKVGGVNYDFDSYGPSINFTIFTFRPDYICGEFGLCINSTHSRVCVDDLGVAPDKIETGSCFDVPAETFVLGFEETVGGFFPPSVYTCQKDWTLFGCNDVLQTIPVQLPANWTTSADKDLSGNFRQNFIRLTGDTATEGTKSLQMNYIPPKPSEPINNGTGGTICGNKTIGDSPFSTTTINQTLFVSINQTFPSPFIQLRFDARKCDKQILQYDYTGDFLGVNCGIRCYAGNCSTEPRGNYRVSVFDSDSFVTVSDVKFTAINSWTFPIIDLSNSGLEVDHNYTIIIGVNPQEQQGVFDPEAHCVYFDNFRVTITERALPECITSCEGLNLLLARQDGNACIFEQIVNSPICAPDIDTAELFENFEPVCIDTTLHFFNNATGLWDQTLDSDICISEQETVVDELNATSPLPDTQAYIDFFSFIFSPIFIYFVFSMIISGVLTGGVARITKNGDGNFQIFGVSMLIFVLIGSLPGIAVIPIWITIAIIVVISLLLAQKLREAGFGKGG